MQNLQQTQPVTQFELSKQLIHSKFFNRCKLSPSARLVLIALCSHYPNIYPSIKTIQEEAGIASKQSVISSLKELARHGLIFYETKKSNNYTFTGLFFDCLDVQKLDINKKQEQKNNKSFKNFSNFRAPQLTKLPKYHHNTHIAGINYPKYKPEKQKQESPLDLNREQAIDFLANLPKNMQNSFFATALRKKWDIQDIQQTQISSNP